MTRTSTRKAVIAPTLAGAEAACLDGLSLGRKIAVVSDRRPDRLVDRLDVVAEFGVAERIGVDEHLVVDHLGIWKILTQLKLFAAAVRDRK